MRKIFSSKRALCAGLVLGGLFTFSSSYATNNDANNDNQQVAATPTNNTRIETSAKPSFIEKFPFSCV